MLRDRSVCRARRDRKRLREDVGGQVRIVSCAVVQPTFWAIEQDGVLVAQLVF